MLATAPIAAAACLSTCRPCCTLHCRPPPTEQKVLPRNLQTTSAYAEAARKVAAALPSSKVSLLDAFSAFRNSGGDWGGRLLGPDGLHLSRAGNDFVFDQLWNFLNSKQLT
jgi:lysophospholipase L1-like esterase